MGEEPGVRLLRLDYRMTPNERTLTDQSLPPSIRLPVRHALQFLVKLRQSLRRGPAILGDHVFERYEPMVVVGFASGLRILAKHCRPRSRRIGLFIER